MPIDVNSCALCGLKLAQPWHSISPRDNVWHLRCERCGRFAITEEAVRFGVPGLSDVVIRQLSSLTREREVHHQVPYCLFDKSPSVAGPAGLYPVAIQELLKNQWPGGLLERVDRALLNLAASSPHFGAQVYFDPEDLPFLFATSPEEMRYFLSHLIEQGFVRADVHRQAVITPGGWNRISVIRQSADIAVRKKVLVAMWFDGSLDFAARQIEAAIRDAREESRFEPIRIDAVEFLGDVVDRVIGTIRESRFIVADFTGHRNGVYFEAGFAEGLGIPVIYTCRTDAMPGAHFDTNHFNHILWGTESELYERLKNRIRAVIP